MTYTPKTIALVRALGSTDRVVSSAAHREMEIIIHRQLDPLLDDMYAEWRRSMSDMGPKSLDIGR